MSRMTKQNTIYTSQRVIDSLSFHMLPEDGGQIVETTYACDSDGVWMRRYDRSDRTTSYSYARYPARATEEKLEFEPQNSRLPRHNRWRDVIVD